MRKWFSGFETKKIIKIRSLSRQALLARERDNLLCSKNNKSLVQTKWGYPSSSTKTGFRGCFLRGNSPGSRARARVCARKLVPRRSARFFLPPTSRARAVDRRVAAVVETKASERSVSRFGRNLSSPKAKEGLIVAVTRQGITLKA